MVERKDQLIRYICFVGAQNVMVLTYPAYETLFRVAKGSYYQLPVILLLPILKVALKNIVLRCMTSMEDMMAEAVIFTVDFFNAVYVATCMQSASSATAVLAITVTDLSQTVFMLYDLHQRTATILPRLRQTVGSSDLDGGSLLSAIYTLCQDPNMFRKQLRANICVRSSLPHTLTSKNKDLLASLDSVPNQVDPSDDRDRNAVKARVVSQCE
ncbi:unnamed protein product [Phytophthora lilii]|uniref:Unnamed protein product n=1 Tax=Phytophthora lilii TaxID=2077276 RepID=A0A9W6TRY6_9STRA|nr:unnamed protein product [Phytophthora lilii]